MTMNKQKNLEIRGEIVLLLKRYETYCYQIAYFILENEELALSAAKQSLISLYQHLEFAAMPETIKRNTVKLTAIQYSLRMKQEIHKKAYKKCT